MHTKLEMTFNASLCCLNLELMVLSFSFNSTILHWFAAPVCILNMWWNDVAERDYNILLLDPPNLTHTGGPVRAMYCDQQIKHQKMHTPTKALRQPYVAEPKVTLIILGVHTSSESILRWVYLKRLFKELCAAYRAGFN